MAPAIAAAPAPGIDNVVYGAQQGQVLVAQPLPPAVGGPLVAPAAYSDTGAEGPYTLDSGDRLRIVVFGQEGLTNSYSVDASGHIAMPLIGSVLARGLTTEDLSRAHRRQAAAGIHPRAPRRGRRSRPTGRSSSSARSRRPGSIPTSPT